MKRRGCVIKPVKISGKKDNRPILGGEMLNYTKGPCCLIASTTSGKTTVLYRMLEAMTMPWTEIVIFCSTILVDPLYIQMMKMLKKKGCEVVAYESLQDGRKNNLGFEVKRLLKKYRKETRKEKGVPVSNSLGFEIQDRIPFPISRLKQSEEAKAIAEMKKIERMKKKCKYQTSDCIIIIDDQTRDALRDRQITDFIKRVRHFAKTIFSVHDIAHVNRDAISQFYTLCMYRGIPPMSLKMIHERFASSMDHRDFVEMYHYFTKEKYSFLTFDKNEDRFRKNFERTINISEK